VAVVEPYRIGGRLALVLSVALYLKRKVGKDGSVINGLQPIAAAANGLRAALESADDVRHLPRHRRASS
jgi:hypothetical protein